MRRCWPEIGRLAEAKIVRLVDDPTTTRKTEMEQPNSQHHQATGSRKLLLAAVVATAIAVTSVTAASASPRGHGIVNRTEYVQVMSASTASGPAGAIAYGAFTAAGEAYLGDARLGKIVFPRGTVGLSRKAGKSTSQFNPKTC